MQVSAAVLFSRLTSKARLRHLQLIVQISDLGNLQKAADAVGMSQPAATHALAELESVLGTPLFERHARGMRPTAVGAGLLPFVRKAMRSLQQCAEVIAAMSTGTTSSLRVGAIGAAVSGLLCRVVPTFNEHHPEVMIDIIQLTPDELILASVQDSLDVVICREPEQLAQGFEFVPIVSDRYVIVCGTRHPLAGKRSVSIVELSQHTWLMPPPDGIAGRDFAHLFEGAHAEPKICWVASRSLLIMWAMVEERELLSFIPHNTVRQLLEAGLLVEIPGLWGRPLAPLGAIVRPSARESPGPVQAFMSDLLASASLT